MHGGFRDSRNTYVSGGAKIVDFAGWRNLIDVLQMCKTAVFLTLLFVFLAQILRRCVFRYPMCAVKRGIEAMV